MESFLPRLIVSVEPTEAPTDPAKMLLAGASIVRFANRFVDRYSKEKTFILAVIIIGSDGSASWYLLYEDVREKAAVRSLLASL